MRELTQTVTVSAENGFAGNCWQTCVACLLDIDPETMPPQAEYDLYTCNEDGSRDLSVKEGKGSKSYTNPLQAYLREHHGLAYMEVHLPDEALAVGGPILFNPEYSGGYHMLTGRTVRSAATGTRHVVVAHHGRTIWDPHPSRAGLLDEIRWAFLIPYPRAWRSFYDSPCVCPTCEKKNP